MKRYLVLVMGPAYGDLASFSALRCANAILEAQQTLVAVFFHGEGVLNAHPYPKLASLETHAAERWQHFSRQFSVPLLLCRTSALRLGFSEHADPQASDLPTLLPPFEVSSLQTLAALSKTCDHVLQF